MPPRRLSNYLKMYRKRSTLTQEEMAFLLGAARDSKVSRYENGRRIPAFPAILAYSIVFNAPLHDLFAGHYEETAITIHKRAQRLLAKLGTKPASPALARKMQFLQELAHRQPPRDITTP